MNKKTIVMSLLLATLLCTYFLVAGAFSSDTDKRVKALVEKMTLEEKVGQMAQVTLDVITQGKSNYESDEPLQLDMSIVRKAVVHYGVGSVLNTANNRARSTQKWREVIGQIQQVAISETRMGIPVLYGIDAIHGATYTAGATFFPQQIGQAATWNRDLVKTGAQITAYETRASGIPWDFSPVLDLGRDPRFPRMWETFGEDVFLAKEMGLQLIEGYQGAENQVSDPYQVAACLKHFLGYSVPVSGKDRTPAIISEMELREKHLPAFKAAIDAGVKSIMINSGLINGVPVHANRNILIQLLREELGFKGLVVTDWKDIDNLYQRDKVATSRKDAVRLAINAGIDMAMIPYDFQFCEDLVALVQEGAVPIERIDEAVTRILTMKFELGLFDSPLTEGVDYQKFGSEAHEAAARQAAEESVTLLKNDGILPLKKNTKILVAGPNANSMRTLNGGWTYSWQGEKVIEFADSYQTIYEAIAEQFGAANVQLEEGVSYDHSGKYWEEKTPEISKAVQAAKKADVVVLCLGENSYTEKPGDLHDLSLSANQIALAEALAKTGKPIVLVLNEGRPRLISKIEPYMQAVVQLYLPGNFGGEALAKILAGAVNPSGKLPYTYPMFAHTLMTYDHKPAEEQDKMEGMYDYESDFAIQFSFGFGLSYTTFEYESLEISDAEIDADDVVSVSVLVKNTGKVAGKEVVQLYSKDLYASVTPDMQRLRAFEKIELEPGAQQKITFKLSARDLAFIDRDGNWRVEEGDFELKIGKLKTTLTITETKVYNQIKKVL